MGENTRIVGQYRVFIVSIFSILIGVILLFVSVQLQSMNEQISDFLSLLGTIFIPSGLIALVNEYFLRQSFKNEMREELRSALSTQFSALSEMELIGIKKVYQTLPQQHIVELTSQAKKKVSILQTWIPDIQLLENSFSTAVDNGASIQILLLDPQSEFIKQRSLDLGYKDSQTGTKNVEANLAELERISVQHDIDKKLSCRVYNVLPSMHIYIIDDVIFLGFFWHGVPSKLGICLEISGTTSHFGSQALIEFERVWSIAKPV
jgi:hypothetical protein